MSQELLLNHGWFLGCYISRRTDFSFAVMTKKLFLFLLILQISFIQYTILCQCKKKNISCLTMSTVLKMASWLALLQKHSLPFPRCKSHAPSSGNKLSLNKEVNAESSHWRKRHSSYFHFFPPLPFSPSSTSSSLAFEISFLSNTNFKRRLHTSAHMHNINTHLIPQGRHGIEAL